VPGWLSASIDTAQALDGLSRRRWAASCAADGDANPPWTRPVLQSTRKTIGRCWRLPEAMPLAASRGATRSPARASVVRFVAISLLPVNVRVSLSKLDSGEK